MTPEGPCWRTSSYSDNGGQCVEIAVNLADSHGVVPVRDSKNPAGPELALTADAFSSFLSALKRGE
ncbi:MULTISPECIES: DUF397 domain-containing protein [unclassified Streptomyces]|uniref:DUF397 domain-containing protein n=1 Tax=unclassified Streptomyces TaxID=2593676 RepID=UPI003814B538